MAVALEYLDAIVLFTKTVEQQLNHLRSVLILLRNAGGILKLKHCSFFAETINFLGHVTKRGRL